MILQTEQTQIRQLLLERPFNAFANRADPDQAALLETPCNTFANRADPDQAALTKAA